TSAGLYELLRSCIGESGLLRVTASSAAFCTWGAIGGLIRRPPWVPSSCLMPMASSSCLTYFMILPVGLLLPQVVRHAFGSNFFHVFGYSVGRSCGLSQPSSTMLFSV